MGKDSAKIFSDSEYDSDGEKIPEPPNKIVNSMTLEKIEDVKTKLRILYLVMNGLKKKYNHKSTSAEQQEKIQKIWESKNDKYKVLWIRLKMYIRAYNRKRRKKKKKKKKKEKYKNKKK